MRAKTLWSIFGVRADAGIGEISPIPAPAYRPPSMAGVNAALFIIAAACQWQGFSWQADTMYSIAYPV